MNFLYHKPTCQNLREALRLEWLETNGLGDYASSTITGCNTRKYHGLFTAALDHPEGRYVLLSTLEESLSAGESEFLFSCRQHPGCFYPKGHEYLREVRIGAWPKFRYRIGDMILTREVLMPQKRHAVFIRYSLKCSRGTPGTLLRIRPLLAFRSFHALTHSNMDLRVWTYPEEQGFKIQPYDGLPPMVMQVDSKFEFLPSPDWYYNVQYLAERERGFDYQEDLFCPGVFEIPITGNQSVLLSASLQPFAAGEADHLWNKETERRTKSARTARTPLGHLAREGARFITWDREGAKSVIAGYPWFDAWGRDTMISLPGLTFYARRPQEGVDILARAAKTVRNGLIANFCGSDGICSYNSADASLWYIWAVREMQENVKNGADLVKQHCWQSVMDIIAAIAGGRAPGISPDSTGLLNVGSGETQLTWMDATVDGKPVTPRNGFPVEINALWYNALSYANKLAEMFGEPPVWPAERLETIKAEFLKRFWDEERGFLADVWRPEGADWSFRPNQIFAAALPEPLLDREQASRMIRQVRTRLLTPYGLRTLAPSEPAYCPLYEGSPAQRDSAYHQGTVWPWLLGAYCDALIYATWQHNQALKALLEKITPLFTKHLHAYGIGSIAEIFDASAPWRPNGCPAQAWSVGEVCRMLYRIRKTSPLVYRQWESQIKEQMKEEAL
jgi:predicted glycogen debranching enzyme